MSTPLISSFTKVPFIYGTAWKKDRTADLVKEAVLAGFRAFDTAAQPKHYQEDFVGHGLRAVYATSKIARSDLFIQTKFTSISGQDRNSIPYDPNAPLETQLRTSVALSLRNLRPTDDPSSEEDSYIDCLLLHSPLETAPATLSAWKTLESYVPDRIRALGISNVSLPLLQALYENSAVKPSIVQNRFYPSTRYDVPLRKFCREQGIIYESFWTLTGNPELLQSPVVKSLAKTAAVSEAVALYSLVQALDIVVLNGTTDAGHMRDDLRDAERLKNWTFVYRSVWDKYVEEFKELIGESS